jgi:hypothetical protein
MLIYGNRATKTGHHNLFGTKCSHCNTANSLEMYTFSRYAHIFWIPLFPYKKEAVTQCNHCKQVLTKKEFDSTLTEKFNDIKTQTKTPYWQFIGLGLIVLGIAAGTYGAAEDNKRDKVFLNAPATGDVYEIRMGTGKYTLYKVASVKADSVFVMPNQYEVNISTGLTKAEMNTPTSFVTDKEEQLGFTKKELLLLKDKGEIMNVRRR